MHVPAQPMQLFPHVFMHSPVQLPSQPVHILLQLAPQVTPHVVHEAPGFFAEELVEILVPLQLLPHAPSQLDEHAVHVLVLTDIVLPLVTLDLQVSEQLVPHPAEQPPVHVF